MELGAVRKRNGRGGDVGQTGGLAARPAVGPTWNGTSGSQPGGFDQDGGGGGVAEREAATVDHANKGASATHLGHKGTFTKPHLTNALAKSGFARQGAYSTRAASGKLTQRHGLGMKTGKNVGGHGTASQIRLSLTVNCRAMRVLRRRVRLGSDCLAGWRRGEGWVWVRAFFAWRIPTQRHFRKRDG